jgi:hypothetical protein
MSDRPGCLGGLLRLAFVTAIFDWLEKRFGFGRGASCGGCGCGVLMLIIFIVIMCGICSGTNWSHFSF